MIRKPADAVDLLLFGVPFGSIADAQRWRASERHLRWEYGLIGTVKPGQFEGYLNWHRRVSEIGESRYPLFSQRARDRCEKRGLARRVLPDHERRLAPKVESERRQVSEVLDVDCFDL